MYHIEEDVFLSAAEVLANLVTENDFKVGRMYPPLSTLKDCSIKVTKGFQVIFYALEYTKPWSLQGGCTLLFPAFSANTLVY